MSYVSLKTFCKKDVIPLNVFLTVLLWIVVLCRWSPWFCLKGIHLNLHGLEVIYIEDFLTPYFAPRPFMSGNQMLLKKSMVRAKVEVGSWLGLCHTKSFLKIYMCNLIVFHAVLFIFCISLSWKSGNYGFERCNRNTVDMEKVQLTLMLIWCSFMSLWISYSLSLRCEKFYYETHIHRARCHW